MQRQFILGVQTASKVNSTYSRIAKAAGIASTAPPSRQILSGQSEALGEVGPRSLYHLQSGGRLQQMLYKVQDSMQTHLKVCEVRSE